MKHLKLSAAARIMAAAVFTAAIGFAFAACNNGTTSGTGSGLRFNLTGAKAIFGTSGSSGSARSVTAGNGIFKILENGTVESTIDQELPEVKNIIRSPVAKDIYINFDWPLWSDEHGWISGAIHVREDGSVFQLGEERIPSFLQGYSFDKNGNIYYGMSVANDDADVGIFKYNPVTGAKQQLSGVSGSAAFFWVQHINVSSDGSYVFAYKDASSYNKDNGMLNDRAARVLEVIPVANPDRAFNLYSGYVSGKVGDKVQSLASFVVHPKDNEVYFVIQEYEIGDVFDNGNGNSVKDFSTRLYKASAKNNWQWESLSFIDPENVYGGEVDIFDVVFASDGSLWCTVNGRVSRLMDRNGQFELYKTNMDGGGIKSSGSYFYFIGGGFYDGSGGANIWRFSPDTLKFEVVFDGRRLPRDYYISSFDVGADYLFFHYYYWDAGWDAGGSDFRLGKMDLRTFEYTEIPHTWNITALIAY